MEPNTKPDKSTSPYCAKDFLPITIVFAMAALSVALIPQGFFGLGRFELAAWVGCACAAYQMTCVGPSRFEVLEDAATKCVTYAAMLLGMLLLLDGMIFPKGTLLLPIYTVKAFFLTVVPFAFLTIWGLESVLVSRKIRSKAKLQKTLDEVREYAKRVSEDAETHLAKLKGQS